MATFSTAAVRLLLAVLVVAGVSGAIYLGVRGRRDDNSQVVGQLTQTLTPEISQTPPLPTTTLPEAIGTATAQSSETGPNGCGDWGDSSVEGTVGFAIASQYGEIRNCGRFAGTWVIITLGKRQANGVRDSGVIALFPCNDDPVCLDNKTDHPIAGWEFVRPPYPGEISILRVVDDETLEISVANDKGGRGFRFNVVTRVFADVTPATPAVEVTPASTGR